MKKIIPLLFVLIFYSAAAQNIPEPTGQWSAGRIIIELTDSSRAAAGDSAEFRVIPLWIWYPVDKRDIVNPDFPLPDEWRREQGKYLDKKAGTSASNYLQNLKVWSIPNAQINLNNIEFPLLFFGPGYTWLPTDYSTIIEDIVSHGYVIAGYVPVGFPGVSQLSSGRFVHGTLSVHQQDIAFEDAVFLLKNVSRINDHLRGIINTAKIGFFGHSQGGTASVYIAGKDNSIKAVVNLDGDLMGSALKVKLRQPALLLSNDERAGISAATEKMDREGRERSEYRRHADWVRATDDNEISLRIRINGIRHLNFNDLGLIPAGLLTDEEKKDKLGSVDGVKALRMISELSRIFFDFTLKEMPFPTFVELEEKFPDVQVILWKGVKFYPGEK